MCHVCSMSAWEQQAIYRGFVFHNETVDASLRERVFSSGSITDNLSFSDETDVFPALGGYLGQTYAIAWSDGNGDGIPDLYVNNHFDPVSFLFLSESAGQYELTSLISAKDKHGVSFVDFDNDGDADLLELVGGGRGQADESESSRFQNNFFVNERGVMTDRAVDLGLDYDVSRGRQPIWFDYDLDGDLDVYLGVIDRSDGIARSQLFRNDQGVFSEVDGILEVGDNSFEKIWQSDLDGDGRNELIGKPSGSKLKVFTPTDDGTFVQADPDRFNLYSGANSQIVIADFNNDLRPDIFYPKETQEFAVSQIASGGLRIFYGTRDKEPIIVRFSTEGDMKFFFGAVGQITNVDVYIGAAGRTPLSVDEEIAARDQSAYGRPDIDIESLDRAVFVWRDEVDGEWVIERKGTSWQTLIAFSSAEITDVSDTATDRQKAGAPDLLQINTGESFETTPLVDQDGLGLVHRSAVAGDFDNDMDVDIIALRSTKSGNQSDTFYENDGAGNFTARSFGDTGIAPATGIGDAIAVADYNVDGFLDVVVSAGLGPQNLVPDGSYQLLKNDGNENNWIMIDLVGTDSNRDAIGAAVYVTAGGITQVREADGGIQHRSQNDTRLHFGLGIHETIEEIRVRWPDGDEQLMTGPIAVNRVIEIVEELDMPTQFGRSGPDTLTGTAANETLIGRGGNDELRGDRGDDLLQGNDGDDTLNGGAGRDALNGADGGDALIGGAGADLLIGGEGLDTLLGRSGFDTLFGGGGADKLDGGPGEDSLSGGDGTDALEGGEGRDTLNGGDGADSITGGGGADSVLGGDSNDTLRGGSWHDTLFGGSGDDLLTGDQGNDRARGDEGDDTLRGGGGQDTLNGSSGNDSLVGADGADRLSGGEGRDTLEGGSGDDVLQGDGGADVLLGGADNDTLLGGIWHDTLEGGEGDDSLLGQNHDDVLIGNAGADTLNGGGGTDWAIYVGTAAVTVDLTAGLGRRGEADGDVLVSIENVSGTAATDWLSGSPTANVLLGGGASDTLVGRGGNDTLIGGEGADRLDGGPGIDKADFSAAATGGVHVDLHTGIGIGGDADGDTFIDVEDALGTGFNDTLEGSQSAANRLQGGGGDDVLVARGDGDILFGGLGDDTLRAFGDAALSGGKGSDTFFFAADKTSVLIRDFERIDEIKLDRDGYLSGRPFSNTMLGQDGEHALIMVDALTTIRILNKTAGEIESLILIV